MQSKASIIVNAERQTLQMLYLHIPYFFENLDIKLRELAKADWNIASVLQSRRDILLDRGDIMSLTSRFQELHIKFQQMIIDICRPQTRLHQCLVKWTDTSQGRMRANIQHDYVRALLTENTKYANISPAYIIESLVTLCAGYTIRDDNDKRQIRKILENDLDLLSQQILDEIQNYKNKFHHTTKFIIYHETLGNQARDWYQALIYDLLNFMERLIHLHVYNIPCLVRNIVADYVPLDLLLVPSPVLIV